MKIPCIDLSKKGLKPGNPEWDSIKGEVKEALSGYGCFVASFDKVCGELGDEVFESLPQIFQIPLETKLLNRKCRYSPSYLGKQISKTYQSLGFNDPTIPGNVESISNLIWPDGNPLFCKKIESYAKKLEETCWMVDRIVLESLGIDGYLEEHRKESEYHLRVNQYELSTGDLSFPVHTDYGFITIIYENQISGLEIQTKDGDWIKCSATGQFIVLTADAFHAWTNGKLHSPSHRVFVSGKDTRYTVVFAACPKLDYTIKAPEELIDDGNPLLYKPYNLSEYLSKETRHLKHFSTSTI